MPNYLFLAAVALAIIGLLAVIRDKRKNNSGNQKNNPEKKTSEKSGGKKSLLSKTVPAVLLLGIVALLGFAIHGKVSEYFAFKTVKEIKNSKPEQTDYQNIQNSSWNRESIIAPVGTWSENVHINGHNLSTFPSGKIKIMTPDGRILHDQPGVHVEWGELPNGDYKFQSEEKSPVSVQVFVN